MNSKSLAIAAFTASLLHADFSYQETTRITGGSLTKMMKFVPGGGKALEPRTSYVYLKGDRMAHVSPENISIIDLASQTMTEVNLEKKTYATITFAEMKEAMEKMAARMSEMQAKNKGAAAPVSTADMTMSVKGTGQTRAFSGLNAREYIMKIAINANNQQGTQPVGLSEIENDMWMTEKVAGYDEIQAFYMKMSQKIGYSPNMNPMLMQQSGSGEAMKKLAEEMAKLNGTPVMTTTRVKGVSALSAMMGQPRPSGGSESASSGSDRPKFGGGLTGMAIGGMMNRRKKEAAKTEESAGGSAPAAATDDSVMMEMQSESSAFSSAAVPAAKVEVPAGLQQVEHPMKKMLNQK